MSGLCPDPLGSPLEGRKKGGLTEGERWSHACTAQDLWQIAATGFYSSYCLVYNTFSTNIANRVHLTVCGVCYGAILGILMHVNV